MMCCMACEIVRRTELHSVTLTAQYILGKKNILAYQLSRPDEVLPKERSLLPRVFKAICGVFGCPHLNLFVTRVNTRLPLYISPVPDLMAWKQDAFQHPWDHLSAYAFLPFARLRPVLLRVLLLTGFSLIRPAERVIHQSFVPGG